MRAAERRAQSPQPARVLAEIDAGIAALFERNPALSGFTVHDPAALSLDGEDGIAKSAQCVVDVTVRAWPGDQGVEAVREEIAYALLDLVEQHSEARDLLRERTFARTLH